MKRNRRSKKAADVHRPRLVDEICWLAGVRRALPGNAYLSRRELLQVLAWMRVKGAAYVNGG